MKSNSLIILVVLISASFQVVHDKLKQQDLSPETLGLIQTAVTAASKSEHDENTGAPGWPVVMELPVKDKDKHMAWVKFYREIDAEEQLNYMEIESILQEPKFDSKSAATLLPYDPLYKFGQGFNLEDASGRASPFIADILYNAMPDSLEGTDGTIKEVIYTSAKDFALDISASLGVRYAGFGVKAAASLSMSAAYSISSKEVVLRSTHSIDGGKSIFSQDKLKLSKEAKYTLATNQQKFRNAYGTHFIVGFTVQCDLDIYYRQTVEDVSQKYAVGLKMSAENKFVDVNGALDVGLSMRESMDQTTVEVKYTGTDGAQYIQGLNLQQLQQALMEFPDSCDTGNVRDYILWPYQQVNDYQKVIANINKAHAMTQIENDSNKVVEDTEVDVLEDVTDAVDVLDRLYTTAILEVKIIQNSIEKEKTYNIDQSGVKKDRMFELDLYEMILFDQYEAMKAQLEETTDRVQDIRLLRKSKLMIDSGRIEVLGGDQGNQMEVLDAMQDYYGRQSDIETGDFECNVAYCKTCSSFSADSCSACAAEFELTSEGTCSGWITIFKQSSGTYLSTDAWMDLNDEEDGEHGDNYSILHRIDDSFKNEQSRYEFRMTWPRDLNSEVYGMTWFQTSTPWTDSSISGYESIENIGFDETFTGLRQGSDALMSGQFYVKYVRNLDYFQAGSTQDVDGGISGPVNQIQSKLCSSTNRCYSCQGSCILDSDCQQGLRCKKPVDSYSTLPGSDWMQVAVTPTGTLWALKTDESVWRKEESSSTWARINGAKVKISAGPDGAWGVNKGNQIYEFKKQWTQVDGSLVDIATGADGTTWGVNSNDDIYRYKGNDQWDNIKGKLTSIGVDADGNAWGINSNKAIYKYNGSPWVGIASDNDGVDIAVGHDSSVFYWTANGLLKKKMDNDSWQTVQGSPKVNDLAVLSKDVYYIVDKAGQIQRFASKMSGEDVDLPGCFGEQVTGSNYCWNPDIAQTAFQQVKIEVKTY